MLRLIRFQRAFFLIYLFVVFIAYSALTHTMSRITLSPDFTLILFNWLVCSIFCGVRSIDKWGEIETMSRRFLEHTMWQCALDNLTMIWHNAWTNLNFFLFAGAASVVKGLSTYVDNRVCLVFPKLMQSRFN